MLTFANCTGTAACAAPCKETETTNPVTTDAQACAIVADVTTSAKCDLVKTTADASVAACTYVDAVPARCLTYLCDVFCWQLDGHE